LSSSNFRIGDDEEWKHAGMTTTTDSLQKSPGKISHWWSLRTRVTLLTLAIFLIGIWALAFYASYTLQSDMERTHGEQQFSTVSIIAADINDELAGRVELLEIMAEKITPAMLGNTAATQTFLDSQLSFKLLFNYGGIVMRLDGTAIAEAPNHGRVGLDYSDRDYVIEALKGKTVIGKPFVGKTAHSPILPCAAPIRDTRGKVIGIVAGITDLRRTNFLNPITDNSYGKTGGYLLVSPKIRTIVYATDKKRIMEVLPAPGGNLLHDRFIHGYEGSGVVVNPHGVEVLASAKGIPVAGWYMVAMIPTEEAFAPIHALRKRFFLAAFFLTLLAGYLTWWMLKRQLSPMLAAAKTLATLTDADHPPTPLPITRQDEIGELIGGFNHLLATLGKREQALQASQEKFRDLYDSAPTGYNEYDAEGRITNVNQTTLDMLGYSPQEMIGQFVWHFNVEEDLARQQILEKLAGLRPPGHALERNYRRKDGTTFPVLIEDRLQKDEQGRVTIRCTVQDITERKRIEQEMRLRTEEAGRSDAERVIIAEIGRVVGATLNLDQVYERVAAETYKLIPFDRFLVNLKKTSNGHFITAYVSGMDNPARRVGIMYPPQRSTTGIVLNTRFGLLIQPDDPEEIRDLYPNLYETFKTGLRSALSVPLISMDEVIGSMNFRSKKLKAYTEQDLHLAERIGMQVAGAIRNAELFENLSKSESKLKKSQGALARLNAQIQAKNKELEQVVYAASHDLRSPLVNIDGYGKEMEYVIEELNKALASDYESTEALRTAALTPMQEMSAALRYIRGSATQMDALLTGLLKLSRTGRAELTIASLNMNELVAGVVAATIFQIKKAGVELHVAELPPCRGDAGQVNQVFANLLGNALKYLDPHRPGVIRISGVVEGERAVYSVEDNGIGIAPAHQEKIFELFHRLEPSKSKGEGLGLTIVRQVMGRLEGEVRVESKPGEGSRFFVALPAVTT